MTTTFQAVLIVAHYIQKYAKVVFAALTAGLALHAYAIEPLTPRMSMVVSDQAAVTSSPAKSPGTTKVRAQQIEALNDALDNLNRIVEHGGWTRVQSKRSLSLGDTGADVIALAQRLGVATGDQFDMLFDSELNTAVVAYQQRHGLDSDGVVGRRTRKHINVDVESRIAQVHSTINRWQELPIDDAERYVMVNIPEFKLRLFEGEEELANMRVVVGKRSSQTPLMVEQLEYLVFNPYWNVPQKITKNELLPKAIADPAYLARQNMEIVSAGEVVDPTQIDWQTIDPSAFDFRLRQRPGPKNALGTVKFIFPNDNAVYIHDTPSKAAFSDSRRTLSHGCVRVEDPNLLARAILKMQNGLSEAEVAATLNSDKTTHVSLKEKLPVFITYHTVIVENGEARFLRDVYNLDKDAVVAPQATLLAAADQSSVQAGGR